MITPWIWHILLVGSGGFLGSICRYKLSNFLSNRFPSVFPYGTLTVNLLGCICIGWVMGHHAHDSITLWAGTGFMGAFTTFSTLKLESLGLLKHKWTGTWLIYTLLTYTLGLLFVFLGYYI
jgi:fluoride exporter